MRHDSALLRDIRKHHGQQQFDILRQLPFFYIPKSPRIYEHVPYIDLIELIEILPFNRFMWMNEITSILHVLTWAKPQDILLIEDWYIPSKVDKSIINAQAYIDAHTLVKSLGVPKLVAQNHKFQEVSKGGDIAVSLFYDMWTDRKEVDQENFYRTMMNGGSKDILAGATNDLKAELFVLYNFFKDAEERGDHLVRVTDENRSVRANEKRNQKGHKYSATHHYIYLDKPTIPYEPNNKVAEKTGRTLRGHHRKAYWKRLTHPRFKNHPKYGQRIRVKSCWVGPEEWADDGKIYTVVRNNNETNGDNNEPERT